MLKNTNSLIRSVIDRALEQDQRTRMLQLFVASQLPELHHTISLPTNSESDTLVHFLNRYIQHVPDFLEALAESTQDAGIYSTVIDVIRLAQSYFDGHSTDDKEPLSMVVLLNHAYLAHRLMEEVNDRFMARVGIPLIPMDLSVSNVIVHAIIGPEFGEKLDRVVAFSLDTYFKDLSEFESAEFNAYISAHKDQNCADTMNNWPCLALTSSISLSANEHAKTPKLH